MTVKERLKKLAAPLLIGAVVLSSVTGFAMAQSGAAATPAPTPAGHQAKVKITDNKASITPGQKNSSVDEEKDNGSEAKEDSALLSKAKISKDDAIKAAKTAYPALNVKTADIGNENGNPVYEVKMSDKNGAVSEVKIDALNGKILATDKDTEEKGGLDNGKPDTGEKDSVDNEKPDNQESGSVNEKSQSGPDTDNVEVEE